MNLKKIVSILFSTHPKADPVRIEGSLSGDALAGEGWLERLKETVEAVSRDRPYSFDLDLSSGRFNVIVVEPMVSKSAFHPDPETALAQDLQNIVEAVPVELRTRIQSTVRILWQEGGEVVGVAYRVAPPGRIQAEKRIRAEEDYDRLAARQAAEGLPYQRGSRLPRWAILLIGLVVFVAGTIAVYHLSPGVRMDQLEATLTEQIDLNGFKGLIEIKDPAGASEGISFIVQPLAACVEIMNTPIEDQEDPLLKAAVQALVDNRIYLELFDEAGELFLRMPLELPGFDGLAPLQVRTGPISLPSRPASARLTP